MASYIQGKYTKCIFKNNTGYNIGVFRVSDSNDPSLADYIGRSITFTGYFHDLNEIDTYLFYGKLVTHEKYGEQFQVESYERCMPEEKDSIVEFLTSGLFKGIGEAKAKKIVDVLGKDTLKIILETPDNLLLIPSISKKNVDTLHNKLKESKLNGAQTVKVQDVWTLRDVYMDGVERLRKYAKKFANMNYKTTAKLEEDLEKFNQIYDEVESKVEKVMNSTVVVSIDKMLAFIDAECSGNGRVLKTLEEYTIEFKEMGNSAKALTKKADILGPDIIQKHVGFIKRIGMKIANFMKRIIVKIVTTCCLLIG